MQLNYRVITSHQVSSVTDFFPNYQKTTVSINGFNVSMAIASTDEQRIRGLSGLDKMNENEGMIFLFDEPSKARILDEQNEFSHRHNLAGFKQ